MGTKYNSKTGFWEASFCKRHPTTGMPYSARRTKCKSEAEAKREERKLIQLISEKLHSTVMPKWKDFIHEFYKRCQNECTQKTAQNYLQCINLYTLSIWGEKRLDEISTDDIRTLINVSLGDKSKSHQRNVLHFIRRTFSLAVDRNNKIKNPTPEIKFRMGDKIKMVLNEEQMGTLIRRAKEYKWEWYPHIAMALYTGMRNGELFALTWDKVNLDQRTILVDQSWNKIDGFKCTKSGVDRIVEIAPPLIAIIKELKEDSIDSEFVLPRISQWLTGGQAHALKTFCMGVGLPLVRFHDLRASWATVMLSKGIEPAKVMMMAGWKEMKTMMVYLRKSGISIRGITNDLNFQNIAPSSNNNVLSFKECSRM
jgi:integrase